MDRRSVLTALTFAGIGTASGATLLQTISPAIAQVGAQSDMTAEQYPWGNPVIDMHFHSRETPEADFIHMDGAGETVSVLLTRVPNQLAVANQTIGKYLGRFYLFTSVDVMQPDAIETLRKTAFAGTRGIGELSGADVAIDGPEMRRVYQLAGEMQLPVITHYQDYSYSSEAPLKPNPGFTRPQFPKLEAMIKAYPKTTFILHGPSTWANISVDVPPVPYPSGPIKPGGLTDKYLTDYPNTYASVDATSAFNAFNRDTGYAKGFLIKHQNKLLFGSDCPCIDGRGQTGRPHHAGLMELPVFQMLEGKCQARAILAQLKGLTSPDIFRKITWENGIKLLKLPV